MVFRHRGQGGESVETLLEEKPARIDGPARHSVESALYHKIAAGLVHAQFEVVHDYKQSRMVDRQSVSLAIALKACLIERSPYVIAWIV